MTGLAGSDSSSRAESGFGSSASASADPSDVPPVEKATSVWDDRIRDQLAEVVEQGRWRQPREFDALGPIGRLADPVPAPPQKHESVQAKIPNPAATRAPDGEIVSFASNDYLGLSARPEVIAAAHAALDRWGTGAGASRLVTGSRPIHRELEHELADWKGTEAAVCFPTGFAANLGSLCVLGGPGVRVLSDELNHASIIDGCRLSRSQLAVYRHRDMAHLEELLAAADTRDAARSRGTAGRGTSLPTIVVSDSVFSMDGDTAPLDDLLTLCADHGALLLLDEAHAVLGPHLPPTPGNGGRRWAGEGGDRDGAHVGAHERTVGVPPEVAYNVGQDVGRADVGRPDVVRIGTLSKTLGSLGGFVAGSRDVIDLMVNRARSYIFSTALPPADAAAALAALRILRSEEGDALTGRLASLIARMSEAGLAPPDHPSPIIPVVLGPEQAALDASTSLLAAGLWVPAIRPPTVPVGTSRLRVTLSAAHRDEDVERLIEALLRLERQPLPLPSAAATPQSDPEFSLAPGRGSTLASDPASRPGSASTAMPAAMPAAR